MSNGNKEAKKEELLEKQEARQLTEEELEQVTGGDAPYDKLADEDVGRKHADLVWEPEVI